jgi:hypothetical protein
MKLSRAGVCAAAVACACWTEPARPGAQATRPEVITLSSSAPPGARLLFETGLNALHTFEYEDANEAFREAQRIDPGFALAYWGEAMTYNQTLWRKEDIGAARRALARLSPSPVAREEKAAGAAEKALIAAQIRRRDGAPICAGPR